MSTNLHTDDAVFGDAFALAIDEYPPFRLS